MEIATSSELIKDLRAEIDALCQGLEKVTSENQAVLAILQKENMAKDEQSHELMLSNHAKEELTAQVDALRRRMAFMEEVKCAMVKSLQVAETALPLKEK